MLKRSAGLDRTFQALADPTRRSMVDRLARGPASVSELAAPLSISLAAVAQHIAVLERSGLVSTRKVGRVRMCRIEPEALALADSWIAERMLWERRLEALGTFLAKTEGD